MTMNKTTGNRTADLQRALPILATWAAARLVVPLGIAAVVFLVVWLLGESFLSVGVGWWSAWWSRTPGCFPIAPGLGV
jgi:hypothetical protein